MKIVCTGYGIKAPKTNNTRQFLSNLKDGVCCLEVIENCGPKNESNIMGLVEDIDFENSKELKRLPKITKIGLAAAKEALESSNIKDIKNKKIGLFFGVSLGAAGEPTLHDAIINSYQNNYKKIPITFAHLANYHSITAAIGYFLGTNGITKTVSTGCTSSLEAIQDAMVYLKSGQIDVAIVGGADCPISEFTTFAFAKTRVLPLNQSLEEGAVPFQENSNGYAMSEGAGAIVLERYEDAVKRDANIKGEIADVISNNDGIYVYSLETVGSQMMSALKEITTDRTPDYVNSQALGIQINDRIEERCSKELFHHQIPYTSIKSMIGNPFGAIGILQVISSILSIEHGFIPPTIRTTKKGYESMNIITTTQFQNVNEVVITNHGYGGNNACAYIKKI